MQSLSRQLVFLTATSLSLYCCGCQKWDTYPSGPVVLICPWAGGGGTDQVSRQVAHLLEQEIGVPVNVINATGGAGVTGHTRGAMARPDGYTITMVTVEINMLHWRGLTNISPKDFEPVGLLNCDAAAIFVRADAPWQDLEQLEEYIRRNPGKVKASGTAQGGIWHLGFAGWLDHEGINPGHAIWVSINGSAPSLQELNAGGLDLVCCSLPEAQPLLDAGRIRCLGVMADKRLERYPEVSTFQEQGIHWKLAGWRGICLPKGSPPEVCRRLSDALERVGRSAEYEAFMAKSGFDATWQDPRQFSSTMQEVDKQLGKLLTSAAMQSMQRTRFGPMLFPAILAILGGTIFLGLITSGQLRLAPQIDPLSLGDVGRISEIAASVAVYVLLAPVAGYLITASLLVVLLLRRLGNRWIVSVVVGVLVVVATYQIFAIVLRVPLPRGWLGW